MNSNKGLHSSPRLSSPFAPYIAIVFSKDGNLAEIGKQAALIVSQGCQLRYKLIAIGGDDIQGHCKQRIKTNTQEYSEFLKANHVVELNIDQDDVQYLLERELEGVNAVVACLGCSLHKKHSLARKIMGFSSSSKYQIQGYGFDKANWQSISFWLTRCAQTIVAALENKSINRLVILSSWESENGLPFNKIMQKANLKPKHRCSGSNGLETAVRGSKLNYLIVKPQQLNPKQQSVRQNVQSTNSQSSPNQSEVVQEELAKFALSEAIRPTLCRMGVCVNTQ